jgi:hypothetical protein
VETAFPHHRIYWGPVAYMNRRIVSDLQTSPYVINVDYLKRLGKKKYLEAHIYTYHKRLFFEKCEDWRDEVEYRWVLFGDEEQDLFFDFQSALLGVVFGASCAEDSIKRVVSLFREQKRTPWFEQLIWQGCAPWVSWRLQWP